MTVKYIRIPLAKTFREKQFFINHNVLAVFPVMIYFADGEGYTFPSIKKIAVLAGIRVEEVKIALNTLVTMKYLLKVDNPPKKIFSTGNIYKLGVITDQKGFNIFMGRSIIKGGLWSDMPKSAKALYLSLKALSLVGEYAISCMDLEKLDIEDELRYEEAVLEERNGFDYEGNRQDHFLKIGNTDLDVHEFSFVPIEKCIPYQLQQMSGIESDRTFRHARAWLADKELILEHPQGMGLILPVDTDYENSHINEALEKITISNKKVDPRAKRSLSFAINRRIKRETSNNKAKSTNGNEGNTIQEKSKS